MENSQETMANDKIEASDLAAKENSSPTKKEKGIEYHNGDEDNFVDAASSSSESTHPDQCMKKKQISCVMEGLRSKESPLFLESWVKLSLSLDGRDKITKVLQYSSRFLAWWLMGHRHAERFQNVKTSLTTSRKAFRLGRSIIELHRLRSLGILQEIVKRLKASFRGSSGETADGQFWKTLGSALKMVGLCGFWFGDNVSFLASSGLFDNLRVQDKTLRLSQRGQLQERASLFANKFYFYGSVAGLAVSLKAYWDCRMKSLTNRKEDTDKEDYQLAREKAGEFVLLLALIKSCCDVLVFSNNPGIDFWVKSRGRKLHEGVHCVAGLLSASTVLYNNFPNKK